MLHGVPNLPSDNVKKVMEHSYVKHLDLSKVDVGKKLRSSNFSQVIYNAPKLKDYS
jgi:hypothetical protein